jgi:hypothetical protein
LLFSFAGSLSFRDYFLRLKLPNMLESLEAALSAPAAADSGNVSVTVSTIVSTVAVASD